MYLIFKQLIIIFYSFIAKNDMFIVYLFKKKFYLAQIEFMKSHDFQKCKVKGVSKLLSLKM